MIKKLIISKELLTYLITLLLLLLPVFSCKSAPDSLKFEEESTVTEQIQEADSEEEVFPQQIAEENNEVPLVQETPSLSMLPEESGNALPPEPLRESGGLAAEQEREITDLLNIITELLQDPPALPAGSDMALLAKPDPEPEKAPEPQKTLEPALPQSEPPLPVPQTKSQPVPMPAAKQTPDPAPSPQQVPQTIPQQTQPPVAGEPVPPVVEQPPAVERREVERLVLPSRPAPESLGDEAVFSRVVRAFTGQMVEIPFRGTGWVYLGELGSRRGIVYDSRRLDVIAGFVEGQSFIFRAVIAGTYILKFYKQDFIQDTIITDYVQVIVGEPDDLVPGRYVDRGRVIAEPRWPPSEYSPDSVQRTQDHAPETAPAVRTAPAADTKPVQSGPAQTSVNNELMLAVPPEASSVEISPPVNPDEYIRRAKQEFDAGKVEQALDTMITMMRRFPDGSDEALWLMGQLLEANSSARDIRLAMDYYRRLVKEYPQSARVPDAQRRIAYLERFYFNLR